jgi:hypothetical protein
MKLDPLRDAIVLPLLLIIGLVGWMATFLGRDQTK